jgi:hypothetical protein
MATKTFGPDDKKKINQTLKTISDAWSRVEAERELVKNAKKDLCKELGLDRKTFTRAAKYFHKQNIDEDEQALEDVRSMLKSLK